MANICPQTGHTNVLIKASLQKRTMLAGSLVAKGKRIISEQKEKRNLRGTRNAPVTFPQNFALDLFSVSPKAMFLLYRIHEKTFGIV